MRKTLLRALIFAAAVVAVSLALDLSLAVYQGGLASVRQFIVFRVALHGATLVFTAAGAAIGFVFLRSYSIPYARIAALGAALGLVSLAAATMAVRAGAYWGILAWLIGGSALVSFLGGKVLGKKEAE